MSKIYLIDCSKKEGESSSCFRSCVPPYGRYMVPGNTHDLCMVCLGAENAWSVIEGADCVHCEHLPMHLLCSQKALFDAEGAFTSIPRGAGPTAAKAALVRFATGSDGGNGDGRVPVFFPTHQIRRPLPGIGSPLGSYFSPRCGELRLRPCVAPV